MNNNSAMASSMLMSDIQRTPFSTPETATTMAAPIIATINRDLHPVRMRHIEQGAQPSVEMQHAKAHVRTDAEHRGHDSQRIHGVTDRPIDALADQRIQRRAQRQWQVMAEGEIRQGHGGQCEHPPTMQAPMQEQHLHRLACGRLAVAGATLGWLQIMRERLGDAEEEQRDADAGGEQHAGPGEITEFRLVVIGAQLDVAVAGQGRG
ncbi:UNVERIFIED_ORG: hypothetical protein ABIB63_002684 [Xanthomonas axonopodis]